MKCSVLILLVSFLCMSSMSYAGNGDLTVGGTLEMTSSTNGFLPPRMTTSARGNLTASPGMLIYNTDDNAYNYYSSSGWKSLAASLPVHDNTGASSDYTLAVGETAKITYTAATSVMLHIATVDGGEYEMIIEGSTPGFSTTFGGTFLKPNNTTGLTNIILRRTEYSLTSNSTSQLYGAGNNGFLVGIYLTNKSVIQIGTSTLNKTAIARIIASYAAPKDDAFDAWSVSTDTTTPWSSLGTIAFGGAQSGTIIVRRIL